MYCLKAIDQIMCTISLLNKKNFPAIWEVTAFHDSGEDNKTALRRSVFSKIEHSEESNITGRYLSVEFSGDDSSTEMDLVNPCNGFEFCSEQNGLISEHSLSRVRVETGMPVRGVLQQRRQEKTLATNIW